MKFEVVGAIGDVETIAAGPAVLKIKRYLDE
jgi:hypothetical protein